MPEQRGRRRSQQPGDDDRSAWNTSTQPGHRKRRGEHPVGSGTGRPAWGPRSCSETVRSWRSSQGSMSDGRGRRSPPAGQPPQDGRTSPSAPAHHENRRECVLKGLPDWPGAMTKQAAVQIRQVIDRRERTRPCTAVEPVPCPMPPRSSVAAVAGDRRSPNVNSPPITGKPAQKRVHEHRADAPAPQRHAEPDRRRSVAARSAWTARVSASSQHRRRNRRRTRTAPCGG